MNLSTPFIKRPIGTSLLAIGVAIAGMIAFILLPVAALPRVDFPTISINAFLPGASPEIMATAVATPLERQLGRIAGITQMTSSSNLGSTNIIVQFDLGRNIDGAARDVQAAINAAQGQLPPNLPSKPTYRKINPADAPIMVIALTSTTHSIGDLYDVASTILQQKLAQSQGVGQVSVGGGSLPSVRVELNPTALNSYGIGLEQVRNAINAANINLPTGEIHQGTVTHSIVTNSQLFLAQQYKPLIIAYRNHAPVRLRDVAEVNDSVENIRAAGLSDGKPAVLLIIFKQPGANVITAVDGVRKIMPQLKASIPAGINMMVTSDRTTTIRASLHDIELTLLIAIFLVIFVTYLFLGSVRAALIPSVAVPLSLLGTFGVMYLLHFTLDNLSLMALTIATGFVVDDAVVVLENTSRHLENGMSSVEAAMLGAKEVGFTVLSMSISLIAVFIPILCMGGLIGRLFREFAVTLSVAILVSLIVSLTVTPMMCAQFLKLNKKKNFLSFSLLRLHNWYEKSLAWALCHARLMLGITVAAIALTIVLFIIVPKGFFPQQDTGRLTGSIQAQQDISFQAIRQKLTAYVKIMLADPAVQHVTGFVGGANASNMGTVYITLKPLAERKISADAVIARLRNKLRAVAGATLTLQAAQDLVVGGRLGSAQYQYTITTGVLNDLNLWTPKILTAVRSVPGVVDVSTNQYDQGLQEYITYDRDSASRLGINVRLINNTLYDAFGQRQVSTMYTLMNQYRVVMEVAPQYSQRPQILHEIYVVNSDGDVVPLDAIAHFVPADTLLVVNHQGQFPAVTVSFNLLPKVALGDVVKKITQAIADVHLPSTMYGGFQGTALAFQASLASQPYLIILALLTVYIVLGILYESIIHPITILSTLPSAGAGALLALLITRTELSIIALIGIILLIGIVKKNAIMMIDFALEVERKEKKSSMAAIYQAAIMRFRPITMTTLAAFFGAFPLAFGFGVGAELRRPLGLAIMGGLVVSQLLTLYTTPVVYLLLDQLSIKCGAYWLAFKLRRGLPTATED